MREKNKRELEKIKKKNVDKGEKTLKGNQKKNNKLASMQQLSTKSETNPLTDSLTGVSHLKRENVDYKDENIKESWRK